ncbi:PadR family transcriptional regulator [Roseivirga pacifica]|uniref:PadR family transcriptional regulator n=1 Tax=Roseivirga pacifica TaxID=1267423 RepID=UPI0020950CB9|nr:PadR family transcriptional regulator [Roseivirga pacifica]MCO6360677.1 PadR family transcriptional regulator [Roseivirga pacifica]MCO6368566.1 PadR family transcriptional regulator [Roseivirga pacifica]MCO6372708.1 PadR family transcriptional regulator [Roseivirga pacifica]MCO6376766.1 PadR family transcriptional regulator [Roseivirga pacifica]MCO6377954.1 PadR family transcriptional regulator [Roseivirga pacifica]
MQRTNIGEFEELVLLLVAILKDNAYGISVMEEIEQQTGRKINISAVHSALDRLEGKGYLDSRVGGATKERGGRRKRYFSINTAGQTALDAIHEQRNRLYNQINLGLKYVAI